MKVPRPATTDGRRKLPTLAAVAAAASIAACAPAGPPAPDRSGGDAGVLAFLADGDTVAVDEYQRTPEALSGSVRFFGGASGQVQALATYRVDYDPQGRPDSAAVRITQLDSHGSPRGDAREWRTFFAADGGAREVEHPGSRWMTAQPGTGALPLFGPSMAMLESIVRRSRSSGAARLPVFHLAAGARVDTATIGWPEPDSAIVTLVGVTTSYRVDPAGRLIEGSAGEGTLRTVRVR